MARTPDYATICRIAAQVAKERINPSHPTHRALIDAAVQWAEEQQQDALVVEHPEVQTVEIAVQNDRAATIIPGFSNGTWPE